MAKTPFKLQSEYQPAGDQPEAIKGLMKGLEKGYKKQTLLGATGTGKTFTMANVIEKWGKPALIIAHNKTLAAQLAQEFREFFPTHAVHYFVSYYDYYQPEAYMPTTDTFIEKDAQINEEIDRLRHASTQSLLTRNDVIIVASVSCIYGLGSPKEYESTNMRISVGDKIPRLEIMQRLIAIQFERTNADLKPGSFRSIGSKVDIMPVSETFMYQVQLSGDTVETILKIDPVSAKIMGEEKNIFIFPAKHFITNDEKKDTALKLIKAELAAQLKHFEKEGKLLEAERIKRRTNYDIAMIREMGYCSGIENYSRHLSGKKAGEPPETLLSYFPHAKDGTPEFITFIDESHVTLPQLHGMFAGDASRKGTLVDFGFRLPSAKDNRPLKYPEFDERVGQVIYTSATPGTFERTESQQVVEQIIRPTGLIDPEIVIRPILEKGGYGGQIQDFIHEAELTIKGGGRVLATTLTKKMAEDLTLYLKDKSMKTEYVHSDIKTMDRIRILTSFRKGEFDCLVGVNLLREGLDLPEVELIGILDADKEGFLRSETSLIQTIGRAARNVKGHVILYADVLTGSMDRAIKETNRRRAVQIEYNKKNGITPKTIMKKINDITEHLDTEHDKSVAFNLAIDTEIFKKEPKKLIKIKQQEMEEAVKELDFETAAILRDEIKALEAQLPPPLKRKLKKGEILID
jgi:excinuclease ABC subunit B